jgi:hypothetical protein
MNSKTVQGRKPFNTIIGVFVAVALLLSCLSVSVAGADQSAIQILLQTPTGLSDFTSQCSYQSGLVYCMQTGKVIGNVPNPAQGTIFNSANQAVGLVKNIPY